MFFFSLAVVADDVDDTFVGVTDDSVNGLHQIGEIAKRIRALSTSDDEDNTQIGETLLFFAGRGRPCTLQHEHCFVCLTSLSTINELHALPAQDVCILV